MPVVFSQYYFLDSETKTFEPGMSLDFPLVGFYLNLKYQISLYISEQLFTGKVVITTLPPIPTSGMTHNDVETLSEMARQQMIDVFHESSKDLVMQKKIAI